MRKALYIFIFLVINACTINSENKIFLFNTLNFQLKSKEEEILIDVKKKDIFESYFAKNNIQLPLYKCIKGEEYTIYLALPINTTIKEMAKLSLASNFKEDTSLTDSIGYAYKKYSLKNENVTTFTKNYDNNLVYVLISTNNPQVADSISSLQSISNRFIIIK